MKEGIDGVYEERNRLVAGYARIARTLGLQVYLMKTAIEGWSEDWHNCIFIETAEGQLSWHFHDSEKHLFSDFEWRLGESLWDGHTTPEKYDRLDRYLRRETVISK